MKTNTHILYEKLKELDFSVFKTNFPNQIQVNPNIKRKMMFIGTEFERVFTSVLSQKYGLKANELRITIKKKATENNSRIKYKEGLEIKKNNLLNIDEYLDNFDYFFKKYNGLTTESNEVEIDEIHIKELLKKTNYDKFKPKKTILTKVKFDTRFKNHIGGVSAEIDLIIDDKIIDIKTDTILKLNKDYIVQLLYYYFLLNYSHSPFKNSKGLLSQLKINKLCLYYASFDIMVEFEIKNIFKNKNIITEIDNLIHIDFMNYNFNIREIIHFAVFNSKINDNYFEETLKKSTENQLNTLKSHIDYIFRFNFESNKNIDLKSDFLIQIIKINLALIELKKTDSISKDNEDLIIKHLIKTFRYSFKKAPVKNLLKLNGKHLFMGIKDYSEINNAKKMIRYYRESFEKKEITKSLYEENSNSYYDLWIEFEDENKQEFDFFLKNINLLYLEFYNQKTNKTITIKEFELVQDFIIKLLEYEIKTNKENDYSKYKLLIKTLKDNEDFLKKGLLSKRYIQDLKHTILCKF